MQKEIIPGRLIVISHNEHVNKLALVLRHAIKNNDVEYKLVIIDIYYNNNTSNNK